ncbi:hypothetical protein [Streptomyces tauricus]|uniref:hypothetical protein n=1 Tax=Streptomyces TaxID=1883 RepID=UPI0033AAEA61
MFQAPARRTTVVTAALTATVLLGMIATAAHAEGTTAPEAAPTATTAPGDLLVTRGLLATTGNNPWD